MALDRTLRDRKTNAGDVAKVGVGTAAGAVLGRVIGGNTKGAVIGGIIGGAIGTQRAVETQDRDVVVPVGLAGRAHVARGVYEVDAKTRARDAGTRLRAQGGSGHLLRPSPLRPPRLHLSSMSRAFVNEDAGGGDALGKYPLPGSRRPAFPLAAARALLRGADEGDTVGAEAATGFYWGDPVARAGGARSSWPRHGKRATSARSSWPSGT